MAGFNKKLGVDRLDEKKMGNGTFSQVNGTFTMGYECRVGTFERKWLRCFWTDKIEREFWNVVVCGEQAAGDEAQGFKTMKAIPDVTGGALGEKRLYLFSG